MYEFQIYQEMIEPGPVDFNHVPKIPLWRWRLVAPNGQIVASSGEGYSRKWSVKRAIKKLSKNIHVV